VTCKPVVGAVVPMPTLLVVVVLVPDVVHCARASCEWHNTAINASRQSAAARMNLSPMLLRLFAIAIFILPFLSTRVFLY
jgi:hypothetical protein